MLIYTIIMTAAREPSTEDSGVKEQGTLPARHARVSLKFPRSRMRSGSRLTPGSSGNGAWLAALGLCGGISWQPNGASASWPDDEREDGRTPGQLLLAWREYLHLA